MFGSRYNATKEAASWTTGDGRTVLIKDMDDKHLLNTVNYLWTRAKNFSDIYYELYKDVEFIEVVDLADQISDGKFKKMLKEVKKRKLLKI
jgi:hypothetical protein